MSKGRISKYTIGTWSRKVARSAIELHGTPGDISRLPPAGRCNKSDQSKRGGWRIEKSTVRRVVPQRREWTNPEMANNLFWEAFGQVPVSELRGALDESTFAGTTFGGAEVQF